MDDISVEYLKYFITVYGEGHSAVNTFVFLNSEFVEDQI